MEDLKDLGPHHHGVLGGLGDHGVPHGHGAHDHPSEDGHGEVPGGDDHPGPQGHVEALVVLPGVGDHLHGGVAVAQGGPGVVLNEVNGLGHVRGGLHPVLAHLVDQGGLQLPLPPPHEGRRLEEEAAPVLLGPVLPGLEGLPGGPRAASASAFPALAVVPTTSLGAEGLRETMRSFVSTHSPRCRGGSGGRTPPAPASGPRAWRAGPPPSGRSQWARSGKVPPSSSSTSSSRRPGSSGRGGGSPASPRSSG